MQIRTDIDSIELSSGKSNGSVVALELAVVIDGVRLLNHRNGLLEGRNLEFN
jgi:hypothetical protein